ncbi:MAG: hypothetical protein KIT59_09950 [Nitrosomonas sp.]|nr:hypothetical protein [Nitrosomonas sp.]
MTRWIFYHFNLAGFFIALQAEPLIAARAKAQQIRKPESVLANLPEQNPINTRDELAEMSGVSARNISKVIKTTG